jgi:hypothetical protein
LIQKENVHSYLELESYRELTLLKEIKENHIQLMRSKRRVQKIKGFGVDQNFKQIKNGESVNEYEDQYQKIVMQKLGLTNVQVNADQNGISVNPKDEK